MAKIWINKEFVETLKSAFSLAKSYDKNDPIAVIREDKNIYVRNDGVVGRFHFDNEVEGSIESIVVPKRLCDFLCCYLNEFPNNAHLLFNDKINVFIEDKNVLRLNPVTAITEPYNFNEVITDVCTVDFNIKDLLLDFSSYTASTENTYSAITGVLLKTSLNNIEMVATDSKRLIAFNKDLFCEKEIEKVISPQVIRKVTRFLTGDVKISSDVGVVFFTSNNITVRCSVQDNSYPINMIRKVLEKSGERTAKFDVRQTYDAVYKTTFTSNINIMYVVLENNTMTITSENSEIGATEITIPCKYNKPPIKIKLNNQLFLDCLHSCKGKVVTTRFNETTPILFESENTRIVLMPLQ